MPDQAPGEPDDVLVARSRRGDQDAFGELIRRWQRPLFSRAMRGGNSVEAADDLVQEALARAWEKRRLWAAGSDLRAWLFTVMHNVFVNQRAPARRDARNVSIDADEDGGAVWQIPVRATQPRQRGPQRHGHERAARDEPGEQGSRES